MELNSQGTADKVGWFHPPPGVLLWKQKVVCVSEIGADVECIHGIANWLIEPEYTRTIQSLFGYSVPVCIQYLDRNLREMAAFRGRIFMYLKGRVMRFLSRSQDDRKYQRGNGCVECLASL